MEASNESPGANNFTGTGVSTSGPKVGEESADSLSREQPTIPPGRKKSINESY